MKNKHLSSQSSDFYNNFLFKENLMHNKLYSYFLFTMIVFAQEVYSLKSKFQWPGQIIESKSWIQNEDNYMKVSGNGYGHLKINSSVYLYNQGFPGAVIEWKNKESYQLRVNNCFKFLLSFSMSLSANFTHPHSAQIISFLIGYTDNQVKKIIHLIPSMSWFEVITNNIPIVNQTSKQQISLLLGRIYDSSDLWLFTTNYHKNLNYNLQIDLVSMLNLTQAYSNSKFPTINFVKRTIQTNFMNYVLDLKSKITIQQIKCCESSIIYLQNTMMYTKVFQSIEYPNQCKISFNGSRVDVATLNFNFLNSSQELKAYQSTAYGYVNNSWLTPIGVHNLPFKSKSYAEMFISYSFNLISLDSISTSVCITINLQDDFNQSSRQFNQNKDKPSAQILICPWWNTSAIKPQRKLGKSVIQFQTYSIFDSTLDWPSYTFVPTTLFEQQSITKLDIYPFVARMLKIKSHLTNYYISGIHIGLRIYSGRGVFTVNQSIFDVSYIPYEMTAECILEYAGKLVSIPNCDGGSLIYKIIIGIMSTPNSALILKMVCALRMIDDLAYYAYHQHQYDRRFRSLALLAWNLTNSKWIIPQMVPVYQSFNYTYKSYLTKDPTYNAPDSYFQLGEDANFLRQTQDFWISSLPLTVITFAIMHYMYHFMQKYYYTKRLSKVFIRFKSFSFIVLSIYGQNVQYFGFRCFSQLYQLLPSDYTQIITIIIAYLMLFFTLFFSLNFYFIFSTLFIQHRKLLIQDYSQKFKTFAYFTSVNFLRFCSSAVHSMLINSRHTQIICLLMIQSVLMVLQILFRRVYLHRTLFFCHMVQNMLRTMLHCIIAIQAHSEYLGIQKKDFEDLTGTLVEIIFAFCIIEMIVSNTVDSDRIPTKSHNVHQINPVQRSPAEPQVVFAIVKKQMAVKELDQTRKSFCRRRSKIITRHRQIKIKEIISKKTRMVITHSKQPTQQIIDT